MDATGTAGGLAAIPTDPSRTPVAHRLHGELRELTQRGDDDVRLGGDGGEHLTQTLAAVVNALADVEDQSFRLRAELVDTGVLPLGLRSRDWDAGPHGERPRVTVVED